MVVVRACIIACACVRVVGHCVGMHNFDCCNRMVVWRLNLALKFFFVLDHNLCALDFKLFFSFGISKMKKLFYNHHLIALYALPFCCDAETCYFIFRKRYKKVDMQRDERSVWHGNGKQVFFFW